MKSTTSKKNLQDFLTALDTFLTLETAEFKDDYITPNSAEILNSLGNKDIMSNIPIERAEKLVSNIENHKNMAQFHYKYEIKKSVIPLIIEKFKNEKKLVWDLIELDGKLCFALGKEADKERYLVLDVDLRDLTPMASADFKLYRENFLKNIAPIMDKNHTPTKISPTNTRTIYIKNDLFFKEMCKTAMQQNNQLFIETCIISFDLIDIIGGASPYNFHNMGQFSFFEKVTDDSSKTIISTLTKDENYDVNPTRPPY